MRACFLTAVLSLRDKGQATAVRMGTRTLRTGRGSGSGRESSFTRAHAMAERTMAAIVSPVTIRTKMDDFEGMLNE